MLTRHIGCAASGHRAGYVCTATGAGDAKLMISPATPASRDAILERSCARAATVFGPPAGPGASVGAAGTGLGADDAGADVAGAGVGALGVAGGGGAPSASGV